MPNIHQMLLIGAPVDKVYRALTTREGLAGWWTPAAEAKPEKDSIARFPFGHDYFKEMKIVELIPSKFVRWTCLHGDAEWVGTNLSFELVPGDKEILLQAFPEAKDQIRQQRRDQDTMVIFNHDNWKGYTPAFAECSYTWGRFLNSLKLYCETGKGKPWPLQHRSEA